MTSATVNLEGASDSEVSVPQEGEATCVPQQEDPFRQSKSAPKQKAEPTTSRRSSTSQSVWWLRLVQPTPLLYTLSLGWALAVVTYTAALGQTLEGGLPTHILAVAGVLAAVPSGAFVVCAKALTQMRRIHAVNRQVMETVRQLNNPVAMASEDVKTVAAAVAAEIGNLRDALREVEEGLSAAQGTFGGRVEQLHQTVHSLHTLIQGMSGHLGKERDAMLELMKVVREEFTSLTQDTSRVFEQIKSRRFDGADIEPAMETQAEDEELDVLKPAKWAKNRVTKAIADVFQEENVRGKSSDFVSDTPHTAEPDIEMPSFLYTPSAEGATSPRMDITTTTPVALPSEEGSDTPRPEGGVIRVERHLYDGLHALSIDFNRLLESNPPSDLWRQYMRGERDVFTVYLFGWLEGQSRRLRTEYDTSEEFRRLATRYIAQYEALADRLVHYETSQSLQEEMTHSVAGKFYEMLMSVSARYSQPI